MRAPYAPGIQLQDSNSVPQRTNLFELSTPNAKTTTSATLVPPTNAGSLALSCPPAQLAAGFMLHKRMPPQGESMRRFHLRNIADMTEIMDSLQLGSSIHPLPYPLPCPTSAFSRPSLIPHRRAPHSGLCKVPVVVWKANKLCGRTSGQSISPFPKGPRNPGTRWWPVERSALLILYLTKTSGVALFLPRFYPALTLMAPITRFYPVFTPFLPCSGRVKCAGVKRRVKTG